MFQYLLASFNRIKQLTLDTRLVKEVLLLSAFNVGMVRMGGVGGASLRVPVKGVGLKTNKTGTSAAVGNLSSYQMQRRV